MTYLNDQSDSLLFQLQHLGGLPIWEGTAVYGHADAATVRALLEAAACFAEDRLLPLAVTGDRQGCTLAAGAVCLPEGSRAVYSEWVGLGFPGDELAVACFERMSRGRVCLDRAASGAMKRRDQVCVAAGKVST